MLWPLSRSASARLRVLLHVQRSGDSGSPLVVGSINRSRSGSNAGCFTTSGVAPAPASRSRLPGGLPGRILQFVAAPSMVCRHIPVARDTRAIEFGPAAFTSAAAHILRVRSLSVLSIASKRIRMRSPNTALCRTDRLSLAWERLLAKGSHDRYQILIKKSRVFVTSAGISQRSATPKDLRLRTAPTGPDMQELFSDDALACWPTRAMAWKRTPHR